MFKLKNTFFRILISLLVGSAINEILIMSNINMRAPQPNFSYLIYSVIIFILLTWYVRVKK